LKHGLEGRKLRGDRKGKEETEMEMAGVRLAARHEKKMKSAKN
jgi:hypothetical protein